MQAATETMERVRSLWHRIADLKQTAHPAAGWFKKKEQPARQSRIIMPRILSPDSVHLRAGAKKDPLRRNPAP